MCVCVCVCACVILIFILHLFVSSASVDFPFCCTVNARCLANTWIQFHLIRDILCICWLFYTLIALLMLSSSLITHNPPLSASFG